MPQIQFGAEQGDYVPLPEGEYDQQIDSAEQGVSGNQNPNLKVKTLIVGGKFDGRKVTHFFSLLPKAGFRIKMLLDSTGTPYKTETGEDGKPRYAFDTDDLAGRYFTASATVRAATEQYPANNDWQKFRGYAAAPTAVAAPTVTTTTVPTAVPAADAPRARRGAA